ncbi:helix-turn-helix domain-containing protein [Mycobacterium sp. pW049]|uniref:helix-turn-helix domain-containing protein n=1 Tax=[Mycobacterium] bulgaricum TaxID=3238985 RepID=UPI00351ADCE1
MTVEDRGGARLTKLLADPERAERVTQIRQQMRDDDRAYAMNLALIRHAADLTQVELARRLGVGQAAVSKVERQHDLLLSTLSSYVAAAGANARIVVTVGDRDLEFDLAALAGPAPTEP